MLCQALRVLSADGRRMPMCVYRVMVALGEAGEPCGAYAVARRAGFLMEHGRVKLHEAARLGMVCSVRVDGQGVLWALTEAGCKELSRVLAELSDYVPPCAGGRRRHKVEAEPVAVPMLPGLEGGARKRRKRKGDGV